jgi:hypothetical protein
MMRGFLGLILMIWTLPVLGNPSDIILSKEGKSQAVIVVSKDASESEKHAAAELASFLKQVTKADFNITDRLANTNVRLLVGPGAAKFVDKDFSTDGLGIEGIVLRTVGNDIILAGGRPRGTLYAVYTFLEDYVGCRWWAPGESTIPYKSTLKIPPLSVRYVPVMEYREPYWGNQQADGDWCVRNKINGGRAEVDNRQGGNISEIGSVHSFYNDISPNKYFKDHPEWFSEIHGKRIGENAQLCMTNKALIEAYVQIVKDKIRSHPGVGAVWVSQNDWEGYCECKECKAINDREETPAGALISFINTIATDVKKEFPDVTIRTLAYEWSQKPPKTIKPCPNVAVWLCTTGCKYNVPITHQWNQTFREALDGWSKVCNRIYVWDYVTNFSAYLCPHPNIRTLGPNESYYADHNVKGVFSLGAYSASGAEMGELRSWVQAKLFWNPYLNGQKLTDEFIYGYYGQAGKYIRDYLNVFHDAIEETGENIYMCEQPLGKKWLTLKTLCEGMEYLQKAKKAVSKEKERSRRVEVAELPLLYVFLFRWDELKEQAHAQKVNWPFENKDIKYVYDHFQAVRNQNKITLISENNARDCFSMIEERVAVGKPSIPPGCEKMSRDNWIVLQDFGMARNTHITSVVKDEQASDGSAILVPGNAAETSVTKELWRVPLVYQAVAKKHKIRVFLSVRCETKEGTGTAFRCGIDSIGKVLNVNTSEIKNNQYHSYELGTFEDLTGWKNLWITSGNNPVVKGVWIDRIWLVEE